ncbi:hypothetical protein, partial [Flavobacterium sp. A45]|uniref:hypothetical protein n=1 Tax=Flavobacterium sp. A45 TaxID=1945862 RepID=UPI001C2BEDE3
MISINKQTFEKLLNFLKHPITALVFGVLVSYIFYLISKKNKIPSYYISPPTLVAQKNDNN